jgi:c-di-GMP-binding flagellar brake protein YcgR
MRPRRILTVQEACEMIDQAVRESALAVLSVQQEGEWSTFKSRFLERDPHRRFIVLDYQEFPGRPVVPVSPGQYVGLSFRHKSRKVMFATVVEARGRFLVDQNNSIAAVRYRWPDSMTELQRRAYYRTPVPPGTSVAMDLWPGGVAGRDAANAALGRLRGEAADLSCGGALVRVQGGSRPDWKENQTLGIEMHLPDGRPPILMDAYYRGVRQEHAGALGIAIQFVGLELSVDGRALLQRLARCVQKFHRLAQANELSSRDRPFRSL